MKAQFCFTFVSLLLASPAFALPKAALLTSIDIEVIYSGLPPHQKERFNEELEGHLSYLEMIESYFRKTFPEGDWEVEIHHKVDQHQLSQFLQSPSYKAIYWISHGGAGPRTSPVLSSEGILDILGFEISPIFQSVNPSLNFLGIISCVSKIVLRDTIATHKRLNPGLQVVSFDGPIDIKAAFLKTLTQGLEYLQTLQATIENTGDQSIVHKGFESDQSVRIKVIRSCESSNSMVFFPALRVESQSGKLLGTLSRCKRGELVDSTFLLPKSEPSWNVKILSGDHPGDLPFSFEFGELNLASDPPGFRWDLFTRKQDEKPYGKFMRLFIFSNDPK